MEKIRFFSLWIAGLCITLFLIQNIISGFTEFFMLTSNALTMPWQFLTAVFLHGSPIHLLYNLFALFFFGLVVERLIGSRRFLILFILSGVIVNILSFSFYPSSLGASGAIMALIGVAALLKPMMVVWAFGLPMPMFVLAIIWVGGSILGIFGFGDQSTGHIAHLFGILIGLIYGLYLRLRKKRHIENAGFVFQRKIVLPEAEMRRWEDVNLR